MTFFNTENAYSKLDHIFYQLNSKSCLELTKVKVFLLTSLVKIAQQRIIIQYELCTNNFFFFYFRAVTSRPYVASNVKFPAAANSDATSSSYQNYDHFLQETFAPDLGSGSQQTAAAETPAYTRQKKKDRSKSRYRNPTKHYEVRDEPEERGDTYDDIETVEADYEGWQPSDSKK